LLNNSQKENKRILITGGHLTPAIAVTEELQKRGFNNIIWVGTKYTHRNKSDNSAEYKTVEKLNIKFIHLQTGKLYRKWNRITIRDALYYLFMIPLGFINAFLINLKYKPDLIMSFGGYIALPIVFSAFVFRKKIITHEQTVVIGLANKIISSLANKVLVSWEQTLPKDSKKHILTGNPIPKIFIDAYALPQEKLFNNDLQTIFITGGNQGSQVINKNLRSILPKLLANYNIIHQYGSDIDMIDFISSFNIDPNKYKGKYYPYDYDSTIEHAKHMRFSDLVISRSGANTMSVLLYYKKIALLIPIPWSSNNEQNLNAKLLEESGLGVIINQYDLNEEVLFETIVKTLSTVNDIKEANVKFIPDAQNNIVNIINDTL
jgi:UDP-N-acetylglucosamine--N-acetylmuramyl-(pentapeptide) pyrophosphoryl-undecaprenol N-acetylglucosamine transferase